MKNRPLQAASIFAVLIGLTLLFLVAGFWDLRPELVAAEPGHQIIVAQAPSSPSAKPRIAPNLPCDPIMISGITGECAGTGDPLGFAGDAEKAGLKEHPLALELSDLPKDRYGLIDWATAIKETRVKPLDSLDPNEKPQPPLDLDIAIFTKSQFQPDVIFPHFVHTLWLTCINCHPSIFPMNAKEANRIMTMPKIASGEFCGRCHNRVAFPLSDCLRCHVKPKDVPPIDPDFRGFPQPSGATR